MTKDDLIFYIQTKKEFEFKYNGKIYNMTYDDTAGKSFIIFGRLYEGVRYNSYGELMNNARIENHFLKDMLDVIQPE